MATRRQLLTVAEQFGATVAIDLQYGRYEVIAKEGKRWQANGCESYVVDYGYRGDSANAYEELIEAMTWGGGYL